MLPNHLRNLASANSTLRSAVRTILVQSFKLTLPPTRQCRRRFDSVMILISFIQTWSVCLNLDPPSGTSRKPTAYANVHRCSKGAVLAPGSDNSGDEDATAYFFHKRISFCNSSVTHISTAGLIADQLSIPGSDAALRLDAGQAAGS